MEGKADAGAYMCRGDCCLWAGHNISWWEGQLHAEVLGAQEKLSCPVVWPQSGCTWALASSHGRPTSGHIGCISGPQTYEFRKYLGRSFKNAKAWDTTPEIVIWYLQVTTTGTLCSSTSTWELWSFMRNIYIYTDIYCKDLVVKSII